MMWKKGLITIISVSWLLGLLTACGDQKVVGKVMNDDVLNEKDTDENSEHFMESDVFTEEIEESSKTQIEKTGEYSIEELSIKRDDLNIYGELYLPEDGREVYPTVIIGHEYGADHNSVSQYAEMFAQEGFAAYIFDFCGGSSSSQSDGSLLEMSVMTEVADMEAVLDQIRDQDFVDTDNIFMMGASQGGLVAAVAASERELEIQGLILYYPALIIPDTARARFSSIDEIPAKNNNLGITVGKAYYADIMDLYVDDVMAGFTKDVLIIHGDSDGLVPFAVSEHAAEIYPSATLVPLEGASHVFYGEDAHKAGRLTIEYMESHLHKSE